MHVVSKYNSEHPKAIGRRETRSESHSNLPIDIGGNLRRIRLQHGYSLEALAHRSGVSRAMLGQIETGKSVPTVTLIWKIADALGLPVSTLLESTKACRAVLLPRASGRVLTRSDGRFTMRAFTSPEIDLRAEFYELRIVAGHRECVEAYAHGARASLVVTRGVIELSLNDRDCFTLNEGDAILYEADTVQFYSNPGAAEAIAYLVIAPSRNGGSAR
jgi:transcriptional regulator with XRE-family HTH domain